MKITVGIACYKQKKWLYRCLRSLASQTVPTEDFEVIIVNDDPDPKEKIEDICENMKDDLNIRIINNSKNLGLPASLNKILSVSKGRYFVRVDSDDYVSKHFLNTLSLFLEYNRSFQAVACDYKKVNEVGTTFETCSAESSPIACGVMFTYESLCEIGFYDESFKMREGHNLIERFNTKFKVFNLPMALYRYRIHKENRTSNKDELAKYDNMLGSNS